MSYETTSDGTVIRFQKTYQLWIRYNSLAADDRVWRMVDFFASVESAMKHVRSEYPTNTYSNYIVKVKAY